MVLLELEIPEIPVAQARPRVTRRGGYFHAYTPTETVRAQTRVREWARKALGTSWRPVTGPVRLSVTVYRPAPTAVPKGRLAVALPTQRPDLDNYLKLVVDALTLNSDGFGVWVDDSQIVEVVASKRYAVGRAPGWQILVERPAGWVEEPAA
jgi:Holliday junction resolvase RusA-like endonuclease